MFNLDQAIAEWRRQMTAAGIKSTEFLNELESHLRDDIEQQTRAGLDPQKAFDSAIQRMGQADSLKSEFAKVRGFKPTLLGKLKALLLGSREVPFPSLHDFAPNARLTLELARAEAAGFHHDFIGTEHVLLGLLKSDHGALPNILQKIGLDHETIRREIELIVGNGPVHETTAAIPYTPRVRKALQLATTEAKAFRHTRVRPEHIFLGLLIEGGGVAALVLKKLGIQIEKAREEILKELDPKRAGS